MKKKETFTVDEGYFFGLGFFETIAVKKGRPLLLDWHLERLVDSCRFLGITFPYSAAAVEKLLAEKNCPENGVLKIVASEENILFLTRENHYGPADYEKGFHLAYTKVRRNETSPLTYRKSLNYGDCILEKRAVRGSAVQEPVFLNTRGEIAEPVLCKRRDAAYTGDFFRAFTGDPAPVGAGNRKKRGLAGGGETDTAGRGKDIRGMFCDQFPSGHHASERTGGCEIPEPEHNGRLDGAL